MRINRARNEMNTKSSLKLKKKSLKQKKDNKKCLIHLDCIWIFLSNLLKMEELTSGKTRTMEDEEDLSCKSENNEETLSVMTEPKKMRKTRVFRLPRIGCTIPFLIKLFNNLRNSGAVSFDDGQMTQTINIVEKAKKDFDEGVKWNGNIDICENIKLKLYSSGLVLHYKI